MNGEPKRIKRSSFIKRVDGQVTRRTSRSLSFDEDMTEVEETTDEVSMVALGCAHKGPEPSGWCTFCGRSLCHQCAQSICQLCGRVTCPNCLRHSAGYVVCRRCRFRAFWRRLWEGGF